MSHYDDFYPRTKARKVEGGIKADSRRGGFAKSWWARRWISVLESFDMGARLDRGRRYARQGQVIGIDVDRELVTAEVQGSRARPYKVVIRVQALTREEWRQVGEQLARQALFAAKLLADEMPEDIEEVFAGAGLSLFPTRRADLETRCSCPDSANPCKHIAAVYYLLGEEFDRDPFLIFRLRGLDREELVDLITASATARVATAEPNLQLVEAEPEAAPAEPLPLDPPDFWHGAPLPDDPFGEVSQPAVNAAPVQRLGKFPFWRGEEALLTTVAPLYRRASAAGVELLLTGDEPAEA